MPLQSGDLLYNRYRVERVLGQGGMGAVYLAHDETLGLECAVKENLNVSPESERQFKREATLLATLRHPSLPRVTNHFILGGQQYLVMDYIEGEDLKERLNRDGPLPEADVKRWATDICDALVYLHALNPPVVHRDIKPGNIKLNADGDAVLVDFGIAKASHSGQKTTTGAAAFTPGYAPPEQYGMGRTDSRTDQYALAATLYTLLTGNTPPDSMERLLGNVALIPPDQYRPELSPIFSAALVYALGLRPEERFETTAKFKASLLGQAPIPTPTPTIRAPGSSATLMASTQGAAPTVAHASVAETRVGASAAAATVPATQARPAWMIPAIIGGIVIVVGGLLAGGAALGGAFLATRPTETQAVTATVPLIVQVPTDTPEPTDTPAPSATPASTDAPATTDTATPEPPTAAPTIAGPPLGGGSGRIAFVSNRDGLTFQIYTMNYDGSDVQQLTVDDRAKWSPNWELGRLGPLTGSLLTWSPDGTQLLYVAESAPGSGTLDLWVINADGSNPVNLTAPTRAGQVLGDDFHPTWCNDGTIAYTSIRNTSPQVFVMESIENRVQRNYSTARSNPIEYNPMLFPDCRRMLLISTQNGSGELWRVFPSRGAQAQMWATFPSFPGANNENSYRIFLSELSQGNVTLDAALSPDGQYVAYTRLSADGRNIVLTTVSDSQFTMRIQQLTNARSDSQPQWSPDAKYIAFISRRDGGSEQIYRMIFTGNEQTNLSNNQFRELSPAWQPTPPP